MNRAHFRANERSGNIRAVRRKKPVMHGTVHIDPSAVVMGDVVLNDKSSVWPNAVIRADVSSVNIGRVTAIQDCAVVHGGGSPEQDGTRPMPVEVGDYCLVAHGAIVHCKEIGSYSLIGINSVLYKGAIIGEGCIIGMGALILEDKVIPPRSVVVGVGKIIRRLGDDIFDIQRKKAEFYSRLARMSLRKTT